MGFGPTYVAHIPPLEGWYSRDSLCYGVGALLGACGVYNYKMQRNGLALAHSYLRGGLRHLDRHFRCVIAEKIQITLFPFNKKQSAFLL